MFVFDSTIEYSRNRDLVDPEERKIYDLVYLSKVTLILDHPAPAPLPPGLAAPATEPCSSISANSNLQGSGSTTGMMEPARPQDSGVSMAELENSGTSTNSVSKMPATFLGSVIAPPDPASDIPVVLCVTFFGGPLAGDVYYHHILPPPPAWLPRPQLFKLGPTLLSANGRQTREDWLDMNIATVLFVGSRTLMAFYGINDEAGFGPEGWKGFKTEFDGELVCYSCVPSESFAYKVGN